jgi:hypothetical protein
MPLALEEAKKQLSNLVAGHTIALHMAILGEFEFSVNGKALFETPQALPMKGLAKRLCLGEANPS